MNFRQAQRAYDAQTPADPPEPVELPTGRGDPLTALRWCRERRYVLTRYLETRARAMRPVRLPGDVK